MFYTLPNTEQHAALNRHSNVSYKNKQVLYCYTMQTINTLTGRLNRYIERKDMQTSYVIKTDRERTVDKTSGNTHGHMETQTNRQTDRNNHFPTNPLTQHSFHSSNHGLVNPKQHWVPEERQTNSSLRLTLKFKAIKATQSSLSPKAASTLHKLPTCHLKLVTYPKTPCCETGLTKALTIVFLYHLLVFVCVCVFK